MRAKEEKIEAEDAERVKLREEVNTSIIKVKSQGEKQ